MKETLGSTAFRLEYQPHILDREIREDVISYLWEYRFCGQKYDYSLSFSNGKIADIHRNEPMVIKAERAIEDRKNKGLLVKREEAELKGIQRLEDQLGSIKNDGTVIWASPPGSRNEGYGDYGFLYVGKVRNKGFNNKEVLMTAIRIEEPSIQGFNHVFSEVLDRKAEAKEPEDFISSPIVLNQDIDMGFVEKALCKAFSYKEKSEEKDFFEKLLQRMDPLITDFTDLYRFGSDEEKIKALHALENYSLALKKEEMNLTENVIYLKQERKQDLLTIMANFSHEPPKVLGSCGSTGKRESSNILGGKSTLNSILEDDKYGSRAFKCPNCGQMNIRPANELLAYCQHCQSNEVSCSHS